MTLPGHLLSTTFTDGELVNEAKLFARVFGTINGLIDYLTTLGQPARFDGANTAAQSIPNAAFTALSLNSETIDNYSGHSNVTNNSRYTVQTGWDGAYLVIVRVGFTANITGRRGVAVGINGNLVTIPGQTVGAATASGAPTISTMYLTPSLNVADYIEGLAFQDSGGALNTIGVFAQMQCYWVGR